VLRQVKIANYKSIEEMTLDLGRVNVFIGENGAGKSNILEAIAIAGAADAGKLDNEFLAARGVRVTNPEFMRSAFSSKDPDSPIEVTMTGEKGASYTYSLTNDGRPYSTWKNNTSIRSVASEPFLNDFSGLIKTSLEELDDRERLIKLQELIDGMKAIIEKGESASNSFTFKLHADYHAQNHLRLDSSVKDFLIYSPENSSLRVFEREIQVEPLGINGEGLLKLLMVMSHDENQTDIDQIKCALRMLNWFEDFKLNDNEDRTKMEIVDKFLDRDVGPFDQRSANEGFLFITFFFTLFASSLTPRFFAIDNIDASLNPKLAEAMTKQIVTLAEHNNKQVILTTHQPAVLDGLDLNDDDQRLFIISRTSKGKTKAVRYTKPLPLGYPRRMSELFLSGTIGGLPKSF
jgi:predicted ATPase